MNKIKLLLVTALFISLSQGGKAQFYNLQYLTNGGTTTTCKGYVSSYDTTASGCYWTPDGINAYYTYCGNQTYTQTFCSGNGQQIRFTLTDVFDTRLNKDYLYIYDGPSTASTLIGTLTGNINCETTPTYFTSSGTCLTIKWVSTRSNGPFYADGSSVYEGWQGILGCGPLTGCAPNLPAGDDCASAPMICDLSSYCGNTSGWFTPNNASTLSSVYVSGEFCGSIENNSFIEFTAGAASANIIINSYNCASSTTGIQAAIFSAPCGGSPVLKSNCYSQKGVANGGTGPGTFTLTANSLTPGNNYYVMIDGYGGNYCDYTLAASTGVQAYSISSSTTAVCSGSNATLSISPANATSYSWTASTGSAISGSTTSSSITATPSVTTTYSCSIVGNTGCTVTFTQTINVTTTPTVSLTQSTFTTCLNVPVTFTASGATAGNYSWTPTTGMTGSTSATPTVTPSTTATTVYSVTGINGSCSSSAKTVTLTVNPLPTLTLSVSSNTVCSSTSATLTASGANTYTWSSSAGGGLSSASGSSVTASPTNTPITYTVVGTNTATGCLSAIKTTTITVITTPTISLTQSSYTICLNSPVTFTASGATTYTWSPTTNLSGVNSATPVVTPNSTTTTVYSVTGSSGGCNSSAGTVTLTVNPLPNITVVPSSTAICSGGGNATLTASGANTYTWTPAGTLSAATGSVVTATPTNTTSATVYTVTGTDANNCINNSTVSITVNQPPTVTVSGGGGNSQTICGGGLVNTNVNGITFSVTPAGSVNWTNNNTSIGLASSGNGNIATYAAPSVTVNTTGVITATATSASGCASTSGTQLIYTITINPIPGETGETISPAGCGLSNGTIIGATGTNGSGNYSYSWNGGAFGPSSSLTYSAGTYPLQIKDNVTGCISTQNFTIPNAGAPAPPTVTASSTVICAGGTIVLSAPHVAGTTYNWTEANGTNGTGDTYTVTNIPASPNPYTIGVTSTASNCTGTSNTTSITVNPLPNPAISSSNTQICQGNSATLSVTPTGSYSYQWGNSSGDIAGATSTTLSVSASDIYSVTVTNTLTSCSATTSANGTITVNSLPTINTSSVNVTQSNCSVATGSISNVVLTGAATLTYTWTSGSAFPTGIAVANGTGSNANLANMPAGVYCLNVTDGNSCANNFCSIAITNAGAPPQPVLTLAGNDTTYCQGDIIQTLTVTVSSGTLTPTINWYSDAGLTNVIAANSNTYIPSGIPVGTPTTIYAAATSNGCTGTSRPITITINPTPTVSIAPLGSNSVICNGASVVITPTGANTYTLNPGNQTGTSFTLTPATIGTNTYTIDGSNSATGCANTQPNQGTASITVNATPTISIAPLGSNSVICSGASVVITPTGANTYTLNPGNLTGTSFTLTPAAIGTNTYTIDGSNSATGCANAQANQGTASITVNATPTISIAPLGSNSVICSGASVVITPTGANTYTLNPGNLTGTSFTLTPTTIGTNIYTIDGSNSATGCANAQANQGTASITVNATPTVSIAPLGSNSVICSGASVVITPTGATTYTLNPGNLTGTSFTLTPATIGTNTYTIDGSNSTSNCANTPTNQGLVTITVNPTPTIDVSGVSTSTANCGQATGGVSGINVVGGTPNFTYQWYDANGAIQGANSLSLSNVSAGNYTLQVTDAKGCIATEAGGIPTFSVPASIAVQAQFSTNPNPATGTIPLAVTFSNTSSGASSYIWSFGDAANTFTTSTNASFTYTNTGTYTVTLVAINGACTSTVTAIVVAEVPTTIIIPNVFSPNGDNINDAFFINNTGLVSLKCDIFNRWGQLLYSITAPDQSWDGKTPNGLAAPEGTYMYMLQALGLDGKTYKQQGTVTLVR